MIGRLGRLARAACASPPLVGAGWSLGLVAPLLGGAGARDAVRCLAFALAFGLALGVGAELLLRLRRVGRRRVSVALGLVVVLHALVLARAMVDAPSRYAPWLYARGGARRALELVVVDVLGARGVVGLAVALVVLWGAPRLRAWRRLPRDPRALPAALLVAGAGVLAIASPAIARAPGPAASDRAKPNVLVVLVDTFAPERLDAGVTPHLAALVGRGTRFTAAHTTLAAPIAGWTTLLTGAEPSVHGQRGAEPAALGAVEALPARFAAAGYRTALAGDPAAAPLARLGFADVRVPPRAAPGAPVSRVAALFPAPVALFPELAGLGPDPWRVVDDAAVVLSAADPAPFFLVVALDGEGLAPPARWTTAFGAPGYRGRFKYDRAAGPAEGLDAVDVAQRAALGAGALAAIDDALGRLLDRLAALGHAEDTVVALAASCPAAPGAGAGGLAGDRATHVPLVVVAPGATVRAAPALVRDVDLAPTLLALAGLPGEGGGGRSLVPALRGEALVPRLAFAEAAEAAEAAELSPPRGVRAPPAAGVETLAAVLRPRMVRDERWQLVYVPTRAGAGWRLHDLVADPAGAHDVALDHPREVARLRGELWRWMLVDPTAEEVDGMLVPRSTGPR